MLFNFLQTDFSLHVTRREKLVKSISCSYPDMPNNLILLFSGFEHGSTTFRQEHSFYYLTGIEEPGLVLVIDMTGKSTLYVPKEIKERSLWVSTEIELTQKNALRFGLNEIIELDGSCQGPFFLSDKYDQLRERLQRVIQKNGKICTLNPANAYEYLEQRVAIAQLGTFNSDMQSHIENISPVLAEMRRIKDMREIEHMYKAIEITVLAHEAAMQAIADGVIECEVQAALEYIMTSSSVGRAFSSVVASGKNGTVLHYTTHNTTMHDGDLVIVDIGAVYNYYNADLTRTYPVSGKFTKRQRELYDIVLATQEYIADQAKPGYWLKNEKNPKKSLHHLAQIFLKKRGYDRYFPHGIGHYLGLDVHDVGSYETPLREGDVITIEPGIYIPEEKTGIRIEDDYWIVKDGAVCLSEQLPKNPDEIEQLMRQSQ